MPNLRLACLLIILGSQGMTARGAIQLTEFLANDDAPWIELHNPGQAEADLDGYQVRTSLNAADGVTWTFASQRLAPGAYVVIPLGTAPGEVGISLDQGPGFLALVDAEGSPLTTYADYPKQREGVSYGQSGENGDPLFFLSPTPGARNVSGVEGFVSDTTFSVKGGFFDAPFEVAITSATPDATITYTTDGSVPGLFNSGTKIYTGPIAIERTTILRALASKFAYAPTNLDTQSYLFLSDVSDQPRLPDGFPPSWGEGPGAVSAMPGLSDYEVDPRIGNQEYEDQQGETFGLREALQDLPSLSLVLPSKSLWDPKTGLHALARNKGPEWERPISLEYFDLEGNRAFQIDGGFRMQGGWNRFPESLKKSFRLYFRSRYGDAKLRYPLFPDTPVDTFDTLILRSGNGKAWSSPWRPLSGSTNNSLERTTYLRDQLPRDLQRDMGHPTAHGNFVHVYINGLYWGVYNLVERVDEWFARSYAGGDEDEMDVIKWIRSEGMVISAGTADTWNDLLALVRSNVSASATYEKINALLDVENLIDYMLINFYIGNTDWPDNNSYTFRRRAEGERFRFVCWDSEESLVGATANTLSKNNSTTAAELFQRLLGNAEFRVHLADRIQRHFSPNGVLTDDHAYQRLMDRAREIDRAIVGESARWGDTMRPTNPYDRQDWLDELENLAQRFFGRGNGSRESLTLSQMRQAGWVSSISAPLLSPGEGFLEPGASVRIAKKSIFTGGQLYYTTDGSDPRLPGGEINPVAEEGPTELSLEQSATIKARMRNNSGWGPLTEGHYHFGQPARAGRVELTELMYHPAPNRGPEFVELTNVSEVTVNLIGARFSKGITFTFEEDTPLQAGESLIITQDAAWFATHHAPDIPVAGQFADGTRLSNGGETVTLLARDGGVIDSVTYDDTAPWPEAADGGGTSLEKVGDEWQASDEADGTPGQHAPGSLDLLATLTSSVSVTVVEETAHVVVDQRADAAQMTTLTLQSSSDLVHWTDQAAAPTQETIVEGERVRWQWKLPNAAPKALYLRIQITQ